MIDEAAAMADRWEDGEFGEAGRAFVHLEEERAGGGELTLLRLVARDPVEVGGE